MILQTLIHKRILLATRNRALWAFSMLAIVVSATTGLVALTNFRESAETQSATVQQLHDILNNRDLHAYSGLYAVLVRKIPAGAMLFDGSSDSAPDVAVIRGSPAEIELMSSRTTNFWLPRRLTADPIRLLALLLGLAGILYGAEAVAAEKEEGTLRLAMSFPIRRKQLMWADVIAITGVLGVPVGLAGLITAVIFWIKVPEVFEFNFIAQIAALYSVMVMLAMFFVMIGVMLGASGLRHASVTCLAFAIWVGLALLAAPMSPGISGAGDTARGRPFRLSEGVLELANPTSDRVAIGRVPDQILESCRPKGMGLSFLPVNAYFRFAGALTETGKESWYYFCHQVTVLSVESGKSIGKEWRQSQNHMFKGAYPLFQSGPNGIPDWYAGVPWAVRCRYLVIGVANLLLLDGVVLMAISAMCTKLCVREGE
ncbi:MAG: hypothetical protein EPN47_04785 [Acidobacteria bacterium]|nr:MAG: hypothetical protein EPN47_04785 [Acidobacteriota bacterium]